MREAVAHVDQQDRERSAGSRGSSAPTLSVWSQSMGRLVQGMLAKGHGQAALAVFLNISVGLLLDLVVRWGLRTPTDKEFRLGQGQNAWSVEEVRRLITLWQENWTAPAIGQMMGRSAGSVRYKARWLGLPTRSRRGLRRLAPLEAEAVAFRGDAGPAAAPPAPASMPSLGSDIGIADLLPSEANADLVDVSCKVFLASQRGRFASPVLLGQQTGQNEKKRRATLASWTPQMDELLFQQWLADVRVAEIARSLVAESGQTVSKKAILDRARRLKLMRRRRSDLVDIFDDKRSRIAIQRQGYRRLICAKTGRPFWSNDRVAIYHPCALRSMH